eukprot:TRINITY_DN1245_c0_g1_i1.p1 TRINITY_DN1245_c0_g1~~TRINITY_DN1245_c0_g1_i1.p1  ORF type:complete len:567 (+),score=117.96 TRINITY_DN1245_c0_g1_i1:45-1745(+)
MTSSHSLDPVAHEGSLLLSTRSFPGKKMCNFVLRGPLLNFSETGSSDVSIDLRECSMQQNPLNRTWLISLPEKKEYILEASSDSDFSSWNTHFVSVSKKEEKQTLKTDASVKENVQASETVVRSISSDFFKPQSSPASSASWISSASSTSSTSSMGSSTAPAKDVRERKNSRIRPQSMAFNLSRSSSQASISSLDIEHGLSRRKQTRPLAAPTNKEKGADGTQSLRLTKQSKGSHQSHGRLTNAAGLGLSFDHAPFLRQNSSKEELIERFLDQQQMNSIVSSPSNCFCADCTAEDPRSVNFTYGTFICNVCASLHRKILTSSDVKSLDVGYSWGSEKLMFLESKGNAKVNSILEFKVTKGLKPNSSTKMSEKENFVRAKYALLEFWKPFTANFFILYSDQRKKKGFERKLFRLESNEIHICNSDQETEPIEKILLMMLTIKEVDVQTAKECKIDPKSSFWLVTPRASLIVVSQTPEEVNNCMYAIKIVNIRIRSEISPMHHHHHRSNGLSLSAMDSTPVLMLLSSPISPTREEAKKTEQEKTAVEIERSEERRVGKECRSRWSPYH